jgi:hypothetical protein
LHHIELVVLPAVTLTVSTVADAWCIKSTWLKARHSASLNAVKRSTLDRLFKVCVCADNVASDLIMPQSDYRFPIGFGTEVQPCGYPLLNGHIN